MQRPTTTTLLPSSSTPSFIIGPDNKSYKHQYSNIYFIRLRLLREHVEKNAQKRWKNINGNPRLVPRVLEVTKGNLCYIIGTVYMEMPLKPNVMEDLTRDRSIQAPPPPAKFYSPTDKVMLEDESGRIHLVGDCLADKRLVTGVIIAALGMETPNGEFEVVDICTAGFPPQPSSLAQDEDVEMEVDTESQPDSWIAIASGLDVGGDHTSDGRIQLLIEYLTGETEIAEDQIPPSQITRLILAGDTVSSDAVARLAEQPTTAEEKKARKHGKEPPPDLHPVHILASHLDDLSQSLPIHVLPGEFDPSATILPQRPLPRAMFGPAGKQPTFFCESNPTYLRIAPGEIVQDNSVPEEQASNQRVKGARTLLINSGQPLNDLFRYLPNKSNSRLAILESTLKWRHMAPTAPDTLWCHPYVSEDPFILYELPDLYIVGGQRRFGTKLVEVDERSSGATNGQSQGGKKSRCRIILVPHFSRTGVLVLVNLKTLDVKCLQIGFEGIRGGGDKDVSMDEFKAPLPSQMPVEPLMTAPEPSGSPGPM